jgi:hypothetical protein
VAFGTPREAFETPRVDFSRLAASLTILGVPFAIPRASFAAPRVAFADTRVEAVHTRAEVACTRVEETYPHLESRRTSLEATCAKAHDAHSPIDFVRTHLAFAVPLGVRGAAARDQHPLSRGVLPHCDRVRVTSRLQRRASRGERVTVARVPLCSRRARAASRRDRRSHGVLDVSTNGRSWELTLHDRCAHLTSGVCSRRRRITSCQTRQCSRARRRASNAGRSTDKEFVQLGEPFAHLAVLFASLCERFARLDAGRAELRKRSLESATHLTSSTSSFAVFIPAASTSFDDFRRSRSDWPAPWIAASTRDRFIRAR